MRCARAILIAALAVPSAASAQMDWMTPHLDALRFRMILDNNNAVAAAARRRRGTPPAAKAGAARATAVPAPRKDARFAYRSTPATRKAALDGYVRRIARTDPAGAAQLGAQFRQHDMFAFFDRAVMPFGLRPDDAVDALTAYAALGYLVATGAPDPSRAQIAALRRQIAVQGAADPQLADPAARTALAEEMKLLFATLHAGWQSAGKDGSLPAYRKGVRTLFAKGGMDFAHLRLSEAGFAAR